MNSTLKTCLLAPEAGSLLLLFPGRGGTPSTETRHRNADADQTGPVGLVPLLTLLLRRRRS